MALHIHFAMMPGQTNREADHVPEEDIMGLIYRLGLDPGSVDLVVVNGKIVPLSTALQDGDRIKFFPVTSCRC